MQLKGKVVIATTSLGKLREYARSRKRLLDFGDLEFIPPPDKPALLEIQGKPQEIAATKAWHAALKLAPTLPSPLCDMPLLTEDVLLSIPGLKGLPGPYYADWRDLRGLSNTEILAMMEKVTDRRVFATATLGYARPLDGKIILYTGTCEGTVPMEPRGSDEFGFDNIFCMGGKTFADMDPEEKDGVSFRGKVMLAVIRGECTVHDWDAILPKVIRGLLPKLINE